MEEIKEVKFAPGLTADILFVELQSQGREYLRLMSYYSSAMLEMETKFKVLNIEFSNKFDRNPIESIETRLKKPRSIYEKMNRLGLPISVDAIEKNLNDIAGLHQKPERERLSQSAYDCGSADFSLQRKAVHACGSAAANDCDGFLGKFGTQTALQEGYSRRDGGRDCQAAARLRGGRRTDGQADVRHSQTD